MPVTDDIVATVRAYLQADHDEFQRLNAAINRSRDASVAYKAMVIGAFVVAVERKFTKQSSRDEIIDYVANVRSRGPNMPDVLDPTASERMISSVFTDESLSDIDSQAKVKIWTHFATAIVNDEGIYGQELEDFLAKAREVANDLMG